MRKENKTIDLRPGDIVTVNYDPKRKNDHGIALIFDISSDNVQILRISPCTLDSNDLINISDKNLSSGTLSHDYCIDVKNILIVAKTDLVNVLGQVDSNKMDEILRRMIHKLVEKHYDLVHKNDQKFSPGETYIRYAGRVYDADEIKTLVDSSLDFWLTAGKYAKQFEENFTKFLGVKHCILTNSGSSANLLAVSALSSPKLGDKMLKKGDEIITTACGFPTTVNPIIQNGLTPVFIDTDLGTYNIHVDTLEDAVTDKTKAIFLAHTLGNPFNLDKITKICRDNNLWLIEDNCDALGSKYDNKYTGTFGHISTYSFYPPHHITMGEGGALATNDDQLMKLITSFRDWGRDCWCNPGEDETCGKRFSQQLGTLPFGYDHKYTYSHIGYNLKLTDMQAAVGVEQLKKFPAFMKARKTNFKLLNDGMKQYEKYFILPVSEPKSDPCWFGFILSVKDDAGFSRNEIVQYLEKNKIATRMLFAGNITRQPSLMNQKIRIHGSLEVTDFIMNNAFWIGVYPGINLNMINHILETIKKFIKLMT